MRFNKEQASENRRIPLPGVLFCYGQFGVRHKVAPRMLYETCDLLQATIILVKKLTLLSSHKYHNLIRA